MIASCISKAVGAITPNRNSLNLTTRTLTEVFRRLKLTLIQITIAQIELPQIT